MYLCKEVDSAKNLQKVKTGIRTLICNFKYLERHDKHKRLLEAEIQIERIAAYVHNGCQKQLVNDVRQRKLQVCVEDPCTLPTKQRKSGSRHEDIESEWKKHCFICSGICDEFSDKWSLCDVKRKGKPESTRDKI